MEFKSLNIHNRGIYYVLFINFDIFVFHICFAIRLTSYSNHWYISHKSNQSLHVWILTHIRQNKPTFSACIFSWSPHVYFACSVPPVPGCRIWLALCAVWDLGPLFWGSGWCSLSTAQPRISPCRFHFESQITITRRLTLVFKHYQAKKKFQLIGQVFLDSSDQFGSGRGWQNLRKWEKIKFGQKIGQKHLK